MIKNIMVEDARIIFRNFSGKASRYTAEGDRSFAAILPEDIAADALAAGWNVKYLTPREEGESPIPYLSVKVRFDPIPPNIILITSHGKERLTEDTVGTLDFAEIVNVDLIIRPYEYVVKGESGISAYCKSMYVTIAQDIFEEKYYELPDKRHD